MARKTSFIGVRLEPETVRMLDGIASQEGLTRSAVIARLCVRESRSLKILAPLTWLKENFGKMPLEPLEGDPPIELFLGGPPLFPKHWSHGEGGGVKVANRAGKRKKKSSGGGA